MLKRAGLSISVFFCVFILLFALLKTPSETMRYVAKDDDIVCVFKAQDITRENNCELDENGQIKILNGDAYICFEDIDCKFQTIVLNFSKEIKKPFLATFYYDSGDGFNENQKTLVSSMLGDEKLTVCIPDGQYFALRIDVDEGYGFESLEFHAQSASEQIVKAEISMWIYVLSFIVAGISAVVMFFTDKKLNLSQKIYCFILKSKKALVKGLIGFISVGIVSAVAEYAIGHFLVGQASNGVFFNLRRFVFVFGVAFSVVYLFLCRKIAAKKFENVLLGIVLITGSVMILVVPFGHTSWDVESHYKWSLASSHIGDVYVTEADMLIMTNNQYYRPIDTAVKNISNIEYMNKAENSIVGQQNLPFSIAHLPSGILIAVGRLFGGTFYQVNTLAKFANLLVYAFCCYFAAKKLKSGKMILSVIALFPTNIFLATAYSYDFWVTGFVFVGMAYFVGERQQIDKLISTKDTVIMCGSFALACLPKQIYAPLLILPFFMNKKKIDNKKKYYSICTIAIALLFVLLLIRTFAEAEGGGDMRGGEGVSSVGQIKYILGNPFEYAGTLIKFLLGYLSFSTMPQYISNFAYLGMGSGAVVFIVLMILTALTDKNEFDKYASGWLVRTVSIALYFGVSALVATSLYIAFTAVGNNTVLGCQPRYIIPLLYPLLAVIGYNGFNNKINRTVYNYLVLIPCCTVVFYDIYSTMITKWL